VQGSGAIANDADIAMLRKHYNHPSDINPIVARSAFRSVPDPATAYAAPRAKAAGVHVGGPPKLTIGEKRLLLELCPN
jgi:hypothetical protein